MRSYPPYFRVIVKLPFSNLYKASLKKPLKTMFLVRISVTMSSATAALKAVFENDISAVTLSRRNACLISSRKLFVFEKGIYVSPDSFKFKLRDSSLSSHKFIFNSPKILRVSALKYVANSSPKEYIYIPHILLISSSKTSKSLFSGTLL